MFSVLWSPGEARPGDTLLCAGAGRGVFVGAGLTHDAVTFSNASKFDGDRQREIPGSKKAGGKVGWVKQHPQR